MRVNVYTEELMIRSLHHVEVAKARYIDRRTGQETINYGLRIILASSPRLHHSPDDDDRSAVTFWCGSRENIDLFLSTIQTKLAEDEWK